ncbi:hypothetical protein K439DRAFT_1334781, partial [Ramaria rubella]
GPRNHDEINVLLVGDPGSWWEFTILQWQEYVLYVHKLALRGLYTYGKRTCAVGYVTCNPNSTQLMIWKGAHAPVTLHAY